MMNGGETIRKAPGAEPLPATAPAAWPEPLDGLSAQQLQFLHQIVPGALESERAFTIPACVTIAQAILESATSAGWGTSSLFRLANNPFGIKYEHFPKPSPAGPQGGASDLTMTYGAFDAETWEISNGKKIETFAKFQRFQNLSDAFLAHAQLLCSPQYRAAFAARSDWRQFAERLGAKTSPQDSVHCGYSTNPEYGATLINLVERHHFDNPRVLAQLATSGVTFSLTQAGSPTIESVNAASRQIEHHVCEPIKT